MDVFVRFYAVAGQSTSIAVVVIPLPARVLDALLFEVARHAHPPVALEH